MQANFMQTVVPDSFNLTNVITSASIWGFNDGAIKMFICATDATIVPTFLGTTKLDFFQEKC